MDIYELVFGRPLPLVIGLLILAFPLAFLAWRGRGIVRLAPAAPIVLALAVLLGDRLVVTDGEKIDALLAGVCRDLKEGHAQPLGQRMTDDFTIAVSGQSQITGRDNAVTLASGVMGLFSFDTVAIRDEDIARHGTQATANFEVKVTGQSRTIGSAGYTLTRWQLALRRQPDGQWLMEKADLLEYNGQSTAGKNISLNAGGLF
ncbi:MAG: hypothetical protein PHU85_06570 [Phycisphaerae bacterium]|nr:hypothetical protein [Phycisphaerae bacterium]